LREHDQRPAHGETLSSGHSFDLNRQVRWNRDALADGWRGSRTGLRAVSHAFIISSAPLWCRERQSVSGSSGHPGTGPQTALAEVWPNSGCQIGIPLGTQFKDRSQRTPLTETAASKSAVGLRFFTNWR
jgi:hypothetical protein